VSTPAIFPPMADMELLRLAEQYHQAVRSCYISAHAEWAVGADHAIDQMEWVKNRKGQWNGYPPRRWSDPAVRQTAAGCVVIHTSRNSEIVLSERDQAKLVAAALTEVAA